MIELMEDIEDSGVRPFDPPPITDSDKADRAARKVREWLAPEPVNLTFEEWRYLLERRGVFVFLTSKYRGWSNIDNLDLRGLSMFHERLPVIIVNDSDAKKGCACVKVTATLPETAPKKC